MLKKDSNNVLIFASRKASQRKELANAGHKSKLKESSKILVVVGVPIVLLVGMTTASFMQANVIFVSSTTSKIAVEHSISISKLVNSLQIERGLSALYLSSNKTNLKSFRELSHARDKTDIHIAAITLWTELVLAKKDFVNKLQFIEHLNEFRINIIIYDVSFEMNIIFYTDITLGFLNQTSSLIQSPSHDRILVAFDAVLRSIDASGIHRALGAIFFASCHFTVDNLAWFNRVQTEQATFLAQARHFDPTGSVIFDSDEFLTVVKDVESLSKQLLTRGYRQICLNLSSNERVDAGIHWFNNMTLLIDRSTVWSNYIVGELGHHLDGLQAGASHQLILYTIILILVLMTSIMAVYLIHKMTNKISGYAVEVALKTELLKDEKVLTDNLLYQMMPRIIADKLKSNIKLEPEYYECVTVYFSDIVGFTILSAVISPREVIDLLNSLYRLVFII